MDWQELNRRQFPRVNYPCLIVVAGITGSTEKILTETENISVTGLCLIVKRQLIPQTVVNVEIDLMDGLEKICCKGSISRVTKKRALQNDKSDLYEVGIRFINLEQKVKARIAEIVARLISRNKQKN